MMGFTDSLLPLVLVKNLNKPLSCVFTPEWIYRMRRGEWKRDLSGKETSRCVPQNTPLQCQRVWFIPPLQLDLAIVFY